MTDKKLRKLSKTELLWIIRDQEAEILELKERLAQLGYIEDDTAEVETDDESRPTDA